ncbi:hypothetical protein AOLI_G00194690 [Acnodon oligacanthus]
MIPTVESSTSAKMESTIVFTTESSTISTMESNTAATVQSTSALTANPTIISSVESNTTSTVQSTAANTTEPTTVSPVESNTTASLSTGMTSTSFFTSAASIYLSSLPETTQTVQSTGPTAHSSTGFSTDSTTDAAAISATSITMGSASGTTPVLITSVSSQSSTSLAPESITGYTTYTSVSTVVISEPTSSVPEVQTMGVTMEESTSVRGTSEPPSSSASTTAVSTTTVQLIIRQISFTTNEEFFSDLLNSSSQAFISRVARVKLEFEPALEAAFINFIGLTVNRFRSGSIITDMNLQFSDHGRLPNDTTIINTVRNIVIQEVYIVQLSNPQSEEFRVLAVTVAASFDVVYKARYGILFVRTIVLAFRPGTTRAQNVEADVQLIFNENSTTSIPTSTEVVSTLKEAISNPNSGFNLTVDPTSITVLSIPQTVAVILLTNGTFVTAFSDSSSDLFTNRSSMIKTGLEPFFMADYPSAFSSLTLSNFSDGGLSSTGIRMIQNSMDLSFGAYATLPNTTQIGQTIIRAAKNNSLPFQIFTSKIIVNGTVISSSEVSNKISMFTATFMVSLSLFFTWSR